MTRAFVLSGGGSLGAVQVGMLQALGARDVTPDLLVGTSAGAVNALWVACHGMSAESLDELAGIWVHLRRSDVFPLSLAQALPALLGRARGVSSSDRLGELVRAHAGIDGLEDAAIPVHLVATDLLNGTDVLISSGPPGEAVRASAAVPGIFPPVRLDGRWLVDGAMAAHSGVLQAVRLGATEVYLLSAGVACALPAPPRSALGVAMHALTQLIEQRLIAAVADPPPGATVKLLPPLCPVAVSPADFSHAAELIRRGRQASAQWLADGNENLPDQARFLSLHDHGAPREPSPTVLGDPGARRTSVGGS
jgi:NTE family protein